MKRTGDGRQGRETEGNIKRKHYSVNSNIVHLVGSIKWHGIISTTCRIPQSKKNQTILSFCCDDLSHTYYVYVVLRMKIGASSKDIAWQELESSVHHTNFRGMSQIPVADKRIEDKF